MASGPAIKLSNKRNIGKLFESGFDEHTSIHEESPKRMVHSPRQPLSTKPLASVITESLVIVYNPIKTISLYHLLSLQSSVKKIRKTLKSRLQQL